MKTIEEKNIMLAQFMGLEFEDGQERIFIPGLGSKLLDETFNESWDWLMPCVIKCFEVIDCLVDDFQFKLNDALLETNIESLYKIVVEIVEWYNENSKV